MVYQWVSRIQSIMVILALFTVNMANAVTIEHLRGTTEIKSVPERVVVLGQGALDALDYLDIQPVGALHLYLPEEFAKYKDSTTSTGAFHEPDFEALFELKPDLIIVENRMVHLFDEISKIAPSVMFYVQDGQYWEDTQKNWRMIGKIFNQQDRIEAKILETEKQFAQITQEAKQKQLSALVVMSNGGKIAMFDKGSRFSLVFDEFGFEPSVAKQVEPTQGNHGKLISFEYILDAQPDVIYVLDREQIIGSGGGKAKASFDNDLIKATPAGKNNKIVMLDASAWYLRAGGIHATEQLIEDVKKGLK